MRETTWGDWTDALVRERCGLLPREEYLAQLDPKLRRMGRRLGLSTNMMVTAAVVALNGKAVFWSAYSLRYAQEQAAEIRRMIYLCDPTCKPVIIPRHGRSPWRPGPPRNAVSLCDHYPGPTPTRRCSSSSSGSRR